MNHYKVRTSGQSHQRSNMKHQQTQSFCYCLLLYVLYSTYRSLIFSNSLAITDFLVLCTELLHTSPSIAIISIQQNVLCA